MKFNRYGYSVMAMITTAKGSRWPGDISINHKEAGLPEQCVLRPKLFTLDNRLILRVIGQLATRDRDTFRQVLHSLLI